MKEKTRKIYYCDFCKQHRHIKPSMEVHEKFCTANPDRECRLCGCINSRELLKKMENVNSIKELSSICNDCPNCMLMCIRLFFMKRSTFSINPPWWLDFDYKKELESHWNEINQERIESIQGLERQ